MLECLTVAAMMICLKQQTFRFSVCFAWQNVLHIFSIKIKFIASRQSGLRVSELCQDPEQKQPQLLMTQNEKRAKQ